MDRRRKIGILGEKIAKRYLNGQGYQIQEENFYKKHGEIDIIAIDKEGILRFFEVKTRTGSKYGTPQESVTIQKQYKILKTVDSFLKEFSVFLNKDYAIDVIAIELCFITRKARITHIKNAISELDFEDI